MKNANELRKCDLLELSGALLNQKREHFNLRMARAQGQLTQTHELRACRRAHARIKTIMSQKFKAGEV